MSSSSLDEVLERMHQLVKVFRDANTEILMSYSKFQDDLAELSCHWDDENRHEHDRLLGEIRQQIDRTVKQDLEEMRNMLEVRIGKLEAYFEI